MLAALSDRLPEVMFWLLELTCRKPAVALMLAVLPVLVRFNVPPPVWIRTPPPTESVMFSGMVNRFWLTFNVRAPPLMSNAMFRPPTLPVAKP